MIDITDKYAFFYTEWPSNFFRAPFTYKGQNFFCSEQAFMWEKAIKFDDQATAKKILAASTPMEAKNLGREVKNYVDSEWDKVRFDVMYEVNLAKYSQNEDIKRRLLDKKFDGKTFVDDDSVSLGIAPRLCDPCLVGQYGSPYGQMADHDEPPHRRIQEA